MLSKGFLFKALRMYDNKTLTTFKKQNQGVLRQYLEHWIKEYLVSI